MRRLLRWKLRHSSGAGLLTQAAFAARRSRCLHVPLMGLSIAAGGHLGPLFEAEPVEAGGRAPVVPGPPLADVRRRAPPARWLRLHHPLEEGGPLQAAARDHRPGGRRPRLPAAPQRPDAPLEGRGPPGPPGALAASLGAVAQGERLHRRGPGPRQRRPRPDPRRPHALRLRPPGRVGSLCRRVPRRPAARRGRAAGPPDARGQPRARAQEGRGGATRRQSAAPVGRFGGQRRPAVRPRSEPPWGAGVREAVLVSAHEQGSGCARSGGLAPFLLCSPSQACARFASRRLVD
mmetsp:Transcript_60054/g.160582  ORF Transcript_60054/g.160582 Transcript_60054/m.160582 type:complete len:291 (-) Transcript_60054:175-1047(-)